MKDILDKKELDQLFKELDSLFRLPSIIEITPAEISRIQDDATRKSMERKFYLINELFVTPLLTLLNKCVNSVNSKQGYTCDYTPYSLIQRMRLISKELLIFGYEPEYLNTLLPHTVEEVNEGIKAIESRLAFQVIESKNPTARYRKSA